MADPDPQPDNGYRLACVLLPLSMICYIASLTMNVARVEGHVIINNAGINGGRRPFTEVPTNVVEAVVKVNLVGLLLCTHAAIQMLQQQKGVKSHIFQTVG